jgi:hypothetical protein
VPSGVLTKMGNTERMRSAGLLFARTLENVGGVGGAGPGREGYWTIESSWG